MSSKQHYDIIIIGTGAGGGTLAHKLAPSGKKILLLERGDFVRREKANWDSRAVNVEAKYHTKEVWRDKTANHCSRTRIITSAAIQNFMARRSFASARKISAACAIGTAFRRPGRWLMPSLNLITRRPSSFITCTDSAVRTRPNRGQARLTRTLPSVTNRACNNCTKISRALVAGPSTCRWASN